MPMCPHCRMWLSDAAALCSSCGAPAPEPSDVPPPPPPPPSPPPAPPSLGFGAKILISGAVVAVAAGAIWLGVSPDSPLRDSAPPSMTITSYTGVTSPSSGSLAGDVSVTAHIGDEDSMWWILESAEQPNDLEAAYLERALSVPSDVTDPPVHAGRPFVAAVELAPPPSDPRDDLVAVSVRGGEPCEVSYVDVGWAASCVAPAAPGPGSIEVISGTTVLEMPLEVIDPALLRVTVDSPPVSLPGSVVLLSGTIENPSRVAIPLSGEEFSVSGFPECDPWESWPEPGQWYLFVEGEARSWSCRVTAPDREGSYAHTVEITTDDPAVYPGAAPVDFILEVGTPPIIEALDRWWLGEYGEPGDAHQDGEPAESAAYWEAKLSPELPRTAFATLGAFPVVVGVYDTPEEAEAALRASADDAAARVSDTTGSADWCDWGSTEFDSIQIAGHDGYVLSHTYKVADVSPGIGEPEAEGGWCSMTEAEIAQNWQGIAGVVKVTVEDYGWVQGRSLVVVPGVSAAGSHVSDNWGGHWGLAPGAHERLRAELDPVLPP